MIPQQHEFKYETCSNLMWVPYPTLAWRQYLSSPVGIYHKVNLENSLRAQWLSTHLELDSSRSKNYF